MKKLDCIVLLYCGISLSSFALSQLGVAQSHQDSQLKTHPAYSLLGRLLQAPEQVTVHQVSSHNKKGVNGDAGWPLYKDENGDEIIFDAAGPGTVRSMWGTSFDPGAILKFYFDGEVTPRYSINILDFYQGKHTLFPPPLVSYERRGYWGTNPFAGNSFVPVPYEKSLRIAVQGQSNFFHIIYEQYPYGTPLASFNGAEDRTPLVDSFERIGEIPLELKNLETVKTESKTIDIGQTISLLKRENASGIIRFIGIEGDGSPEFFRETYIRMRWDGHSQWDVQSPTGIFFGSPTEANDTRSLPLRVEKLESGRGRLSCYFPMPFWKQAEIELVNRSTHRFALMKSKISISANGIDPNRGTYFTALYREGQTTYNRDWLLFDSPGRGWLAGVVQSMHGSHYCEGNEHFYIDGAISPQINGTGSEDYYLACFWPNLDFDLPFGCVVGDAHKQGGGDQVGAYYVPGCYSRYHLEAPIPFYSSLNAKIQHGGRSDIISDYRSLAFCYLRNHPSLVRTDYIDVGNTASETAHYYKASDSGPVATVEACPEGEYFETLVKGNGRYHAGGEITFLAATDPENRGIRLRRRIDQGIPRQKAEIYIDGKYAGSWYHGYQNEYLRWFDSDFDIHPDLTKGKSRVEVKLIIEKGKSESSFTDFEYTIFCFQN